MHIRIMQYSLSVGQLFVVAVATLASVLGIHWLGLVGFIGLLMLLIGLALAIRLAVWWFTWDGPVVWMPKRDSFLALTFSLIGLILLIIS
jgi:hypothetical protein